MKRHSITTAVLLLVTLNLPATDTMLGNPKSVYIEKGTSSLDLSGTYLDYDAADGARLMSLLTDLDGQVAFGQAQLKTAWFFKDNWSVGGIFGYENTALDGNSVGVLDLVNLSNCHSRDERYKAPIGIRRPLFDSGAQEPYEDEDDIIGYGRMSISKLFRIVIWSIPLGLACCKTTTDFIPQAPDYTDSTMWTTPATLHDTIIVSVSPEYHALVSAGTVVLNMPLTKT